MRPTLLPWTLSVALGFTAGTFAEEREARACGGCFHAETDTSTSFVTDHRMVVSISKQQTVLWDQVKFTGEPSEFAWVLPVREGTRVELAKDEWIEALDQATKPSVKGPDINCMGSGSGGGGAGCGGEMSLATANEDRSASAGGTSFGAGNGVEVISQSVVGPYETVIVRSKSGETIYLWLRINGFAVPNAIEPILSQYTTEGFDFLALRLRPQAGVRSMQPVRVVMPGAIQTLPLRMVAAGVGARVGLTLFVVSEARYRPKNFPSLAIDQDALAWHFSEKRSNYRELMENTLAESGGRGWVTEYAGNPFNGTPVRNHDFSYTIGGSNLVSDTLPRFYRSACAQLGPLSGPCKEPSIVLGPPDGGALSVDAGDADASTVDPTPDASPPAPTPTCLRSACEDFDDDVVATAGLIQSAIWVTRLRAELSADDCAAGDLELEPADPVRLPSQLKTEKFTDPNVDACAGIGRDSGGDNGCACRTTPRQNSWLSSSFALFGVGLVLRRLLSRRR